VPVPPAVAAGSVGAADGAAPAKMAGGACAQRQTAALKAGWAS